MRIPYQELHGELKRILEVLGFTPERADRSARLFADANRDGFESHGLNRFPSYLRGIREGTIDPKAEPVRVGPEGVLERWDGQAGPGNLNAFRCMERAIEIARSAGMGCVALRNTNHWMRGGAYGWQAADADCIGICWTNTMPNMPPWGGTEPRIGNNPMILAVPRGEAHVVLDFAQSLYSYGKLSMYEKRGERLPFPGGFDRQGNLTDDPAVIGESQLPLPIGYWKGAGLSLMLDLIAASLSGGNPSLQISGWQVEQGISQTFIAFDLSRYGDVADRQHMVDQVLSDLHATPVREGAGHVRYPGERTIATRRESLEKGVSVDPEIWEKVRAEER